MSILPTVTREELDDSVTLFDVSNVYVQGTRVRIDGLASMPELNGTIGSIESFSAE